MNHIVRTILLCIALVFSSGGLSPLQGGARRAGGVFALSSLPSAQSSSPSSLTHIRQAYASRDYQLCYDLSAEALEQSELPESKILFYMGISKRLLNEYSEAFRLLEKALDHSVDLDEQTKILLNMGTILYHTNQFEASITLYNQAENMNLSNSPLEGGQGGVFGRGVWLHSVYFNRALSRKALGDVNGAAEDIIRSLKVCEAQNYDHRIARLFNQLGTMDLQSGKIDDARQYFFKTLRTDVDTTYSGVAWHNIAWTDLHNGDTLQAIQSFEKAIPLHKDNHQLFLTYLDLTDLYITLERAGGLSSLEGGARRAEGVLGARRAEGVPEVRGVLNLSHKYYLLADSLLTHNLVPLNDESLLALVTGMKLNKVTPDLMETRMKKFISEKNATLDAYKTYAGKLMMAQLQTEKDLHRKQVIWWTIGAILFIIFIAGYLYYRKKNKSVGDRILMIRNQFQM